MMVSWPVAVHGISEYKVLLPPHDEGGIQLGARKRDVDVEREHVGCCVHLRKDTKGTDRDAMKSRCCMCSGAASRSEPPGPGRLLRH